MSGPSSSAPARSEQTPRPATGSRGGPGPLASDVAADLPSRLASARDRSRDSAGYGDDPGAGVGSDLAGADTSRAGAGPGPAGARAGAAGARPSPVPGRAAATRSGAGPVGAGIRAADAIPGGGADGGEVPEQRIAAVAVDQVAAEGRAVGGDAPD